MRHAGLVAHTYEGAALCFREFCRLGQRSQKLPGYPDISLDHIDFRRSKPFWDSGDYAAVRAILARSVERLARAGAEFFFCSANTAHIALEHDGPELALPGLHIADVVAQAAQADKRRRVAVLGTGATMRAGMYPRALAGRGIGVALPAATDRQALDRMIFDELALGVFTPQAMDRCRGIIQRLATEDCDAVALACTELPLLLDDCSDLALPALDSTRLLSAAALAVGRGDLPLPTWRGGPIAGDIH